MGQYVKCSCLLLFFSVIRGFFLNASAKIDYSLKPPKHFYEKIGDTPHFNIFKRHISYWNRGYGNGFISEPWC
jgi:hypothetical protein